MRSIDQLKKSLIVHSVVAKGAIRIGHVFHPSLCDRNLPCTTLHMQNEVLSGKVVYCLTRVGSQQRALAKLKGQRWWWRQKCCLTTYFDGDRTIGGIAEKLK